MLVQLNIDTGRGLADYFLIVTKTSAHFPTTLAEAVLVCGPPGPSNLVVLAAQSVAQLLMAEVSFALNPGSPANSRHALRIAGPCPPAAPRPAQILRPRARGLGFRANPRANINAGEIPFLQVLL